ncbi:serine palmitoyltransferase small subunit A [Leptopilina heterotoma]|uniref:serine palmitoyltransferase small subunit A n=1 Tax=Leptopilina heterotoma TaxID=63436 RepID=UPI001CAA0D47|nr:serine palmitoyltransferase small subunit A [Leptopilina heterotoma]
MVQIIDKISTFFHYWYFRYLLVTELYMVEKWERHFINIFLISMFCLFFFFNYKAVLPTTSYLLAINES